MFRRLLERLLRHQLPRTLAVIPEGHPYRAKMLVALSMILSTQFERSRDQADLDAAIDAGREAVAALPDGHPDRPGVLSNLCDEMRIRFGRTGSLADLDAAIDAGREAVAATAADHPRRAGRLNNLGIALDARFGRTGSLADLDAAIHAGREAVATASASHPERALYLSNHCIALNVRSRRTGSLADLDAAIHAGREAVATTPADDPSRAARQSNLAGALQTRFGRFGSMADLDAAIDASREAVAATPADDPDRAKILGNLGRALQARFERAGSMADLDAAIDASREAVAALPDGHPARPGILSDYSVAKITRFEWIGPLGDLLFAIQIGREAVAATPADNPNRAFRLSIHGLALRTLFELSGNQDNLDAAIDAHQEAVATTPADDPSRAAYQSNLAGALQTRFGRFGSLADLDAAIDASREAVAATAADDPDRAKMLGNLGRALQARFERFGSLADLDAAIDAGREAVALDGASPLVRTGAARNWGRAAAAGGRWQDAVTGFEASIGLLGRVAPRNLARSDRERLLDYMGGVGSEAAACCVHAGLLDRAVELFEQGRGVLLGQALDARTDLTTLAERYPELAGRFTALQNELGRADDLFGYLMIRPGEAGGPAIGDRANLERRDAERRREAAEAFDRLIAEIRLLGFHGFLQPPPVSELLSATAQGPIVVVTVSDYGSHALILTGAGILEPVLLEAMTPDAVSQRVDGFLSAIDDTSSPDAGSRAAAERRVADTLGWLWDVLAGPVLDRLGITSPPGKGEQWPRLWWCVSGQLSFLPIHAAGHHDLRSDGTSSTVLDRAVSSYTPTIRALTYARRPRAHGSSTAGFDGGGVAVAMPHTPDASPLPGAQVEVAEIKKRFPGQVAVLTGPEAMRSSVLAALSGTRWAHFACHGFADLANPSLSHLLLDDHREQPLTVVDVARLRLDDAEMAFLSACSTARPGSRLTDEAIHLASAFQLAGYRHVVGTLWPIGDQHAVDIAADIYATLVSTGDGTIDVAGAVHAATRRMRRRWGWDRPSVWASHLHSGA